MELWAKMADALKLEKKEHIRNVKSYARASNVAKAGLVFKSLY